MPSSRSRGTALWFSLALVMGIVAGVLNLFTSQLTDAFGDGMGTVITVLGWVCAVVAAVAVYQGVVHAAREQDWYAEGDADRADDGYEAYDDYDEYESYDEYDDYADDEYADDDYAEDGYDDERRPAYAESAGRGPGGQDDVPYPGWDDTLPPPPRESDPWAGRTYADERPIDAPSRDSGWYAPGSERASRPSEGGEDDPWGDDTRPSAPEWRER